MASWVIGPIRGRAVFCLPFLPLFFFLLFLQRHCIVPPQPGGTESESSSGYERRYLYQRTTRGNPPKIKAKANKIHTKTIPIKHVTVQYCYPSFHVLVPAVTPYPHTFTLHYKSNDTSAWLCLRVLIIKHDTTIKPTARDSNMTIKTLVAYR